MMEQNTSTANARGRSYSVKRGTSRLAARFRSRSASISKADRRTQQQDNHEAAAPSNSSIQVTDQIEDIVERHQLAMKMDMMDLIESRVKEVTFWKNKALKLSKRMSLLEKESGERVASVGQELEEAKNKALKGQELQGAKNKALKQKNKALKLKNKMASLEKESRESFMGEELQQASSKEEEGGWKGSEQDLMEKVSVLERELQDRDAQINSLREMMETREKGSVERVRLLENQLERLVGLQTKKVRRGSIETTEASTTASTQLLSSDFDLSNFSDSDKASSSEDDHTHEISALEQLLARVLAEKDRLSFENENLRTVVREKVSMPNDTIGMDGMVSVSNDKMYQLSCRNCSGQHFIGITLGDLKEVAKEHFSTVWEVVQAANGNKGGSCSFRDSNQDPNSMTCDFRDSFLAHHLAGHCRDMESEEDVRKWCRKNVKLEKIVADASVTEEHGRSFEL